MSNSLEADYVDFLQIQGLKGQIDLPRVTAELGLNEEELFELINQRVVRMEEEGYTAQKVGEALGTIFLFGFWLRGLK